MTTTFELSAGFPPKKRSATRVIPKVAYYKMAKPGQFHTKCNECQNGIGFQGTFQGEGAWQGQFDCFSFRKLTR